MSTGHQSLVDASADFLRAFPGILNKDPHSLAAEVDFHGVNDEDATRNRIDRHYRKILDRHKSSGEGRVKILTDCVSSLEHASDLRRGLYVAEGLILAKKLGAGHEQQRSQQLGMEKEAPPLPPKRGFISTQQLSNAGDRSPHFNRRAQSRSRVRSELTGDGSPASTMSSISTRPFGNSFNAAVAARDATLKAATRTRSNLPDLEPALTVERPRYQYDTRERATTSTASGLPGEFSPSARPYSSSVTATNRLYDEQLRHSASSSPTSMPSSSVSTAPTIVHRRFTPLPPIPVASLKEQRVVCGRTAGKNEVPDDVLAEGIARALNGFQSSYCRLSDGVFRPSAGCAISGSRRGAVVRLLQMATHALTMNVQPAHGSDLMMEAFLGGVASVRSHFVQDVMDMQRKYGASFHTRALDMHLVPKWEGALGRVAALVAEAKRRQIKGMRMLQEVYVHYTELVHTGGMEETVIVSLLDAMMFVFANLLRQWLLDGTLNAHNTEFMIKERTGHGGEQGEAAMVKSWHNRFNLDKELVPGFLRRELPGLILSVGKCARLLASDDVDDALSRHRARVSALDISHLYRVDMSERALIGKELKEIEQAICGLVVQRLLQRDLLKQHLKAVHQLFLCLNERYATHLFEAIEAMCRDLGSANSTRTQHAASQAFLAAARTAALAFPFKLPVDAVVKEGSTRDATTPPTSARSGKSRAIIQVTPTYKAPRLAAVALRAAEVEHYQTLFHTIWPVYSLRLAVAEARAELLFRTDAFRRMGRGTSASLRAFQLAMATAGAFFDTVIRYFIQGVEHHAARLAAALDRAGSVEECVKEHKKFLLMLADHVGTQLVGDKRGTSKLIVAIQNARAVLLEEANSLLDLFWAWNNEAERELQLRGGPKATGDEELALGADAASVTLLEFERLEEKYRRDEAEKHQVASSARIMAIYDRFSVQMLKFLDLYEAEGKQSELTKLLLAMRLKKRSERDVPAAQRQRVGPAPIWSAANKA